jgi:Na+/H+ antiporter NhaC
MSLNNEISGTIENDYNLIQIIPYVLVLAGGILGVNVFAVLLTGIVSGSAIMLITGSTKPVALLSNMGAGASGMFETIVVTILVSAICALIREHGGFDALLAGIKRVFRGKKGGQVGMGLLVGVLDIATANNTVAIVMANPIANEIAKEYGISAKKSASILDTFSCVFQAILPYGAQMLVAISAVSALGVSVSALDIIPKLFYPFLLCISSLVAILCTKKHK